MRPLKLLIPRAFEHGRRLFVRSAFFFVLLGLISAQGFVLIRPNWRLANHKDVVVNIGQGGCQSNGISNDYVMGMIEDSIDRYWNTVAESELRLRKGEEVSRVGTNASLAGEILVYCSPLGVNGPSGVTYNQNNGSGVIVLNGSTFVPGGYYEGAWHGILIHEMGHAIGLHHSQDPASVMTYENHGWGAKPNFLAQDDKDGVAYLYPKKGYVDGLIPGCAAIASSGQGLHVSHPASWQSALFELLLMALSLMFLRTLAAKKV